MESVSTYSEARNEYLKQLATWIVPFMIQYYRNVWTQSSKTGQQRAMVVFQERCAEVPKWNKDTIDENVGKLLDSCRCDYLEELMAAVFIAHTKVLIAIRVTSKHKKLQITLPKLDHFIHRVFSECARSFWKAPYLFLDDQKPIEMQKNLLHAEALCNEAIGAAVRSLLPIKNILNEYLSDDVLTNEPVIEEAEKTEEKPAPEPVKIPEPVKAPEPVKVPEPVSKPEEAVSEQVKVKETICEEEKVAEPVSELISDIKSVSVSKTHDDDTVKQVVMESKDDQKGGAVVEEPEELSIDTEKASVHFSNYDNVFDEASEQVGSFKYVPKDLEPGDLPKLEIKEDTGSPLSLDSSVTDLDAPGDESLADEVLE
jgi:hypothetical protein